MPSLMKIVVIGVGGGGCRVVEVLSQQPGRALSCVVLNGDRATLACSSVDNRILLQPGTDDAQWSRQVAEASAKAAAHDIAGWVHAADLCCVVATLGGATGSGASPVVAGLTRELRIPTIVVATLPFHWEGAQRHRNAAYAQGLLDECPERPEWIRLDDLLARDPQMTMDGALQYVAEKAKSAIDAFDAGESHRTRPATRRTNESGGPFFKQNG